MIKVKSLKLEELTGYRFSIFRFNTNMQSVYLFHIGDTLIDTGQSKSREEVVKKLDALNIKKIILTHHHEDHTGNAAYLSRRYEVPVYAHPKCVQMLKVGLKLPPLGAIISGGVEKVRAKKLLEDEIIETGDYTLKPVYTPGHTSDHYSFYMKEKGWLFSGDLYVADKIKYFSDNESMKQQIESLEKLCALDFDVLLCSHNPKLENGKKHLEKKLQGFKEFYEKVLFLHSKGYNFNSILKETGRKENNFYNIVTLGSFNAINMVKSVLRDEGLSSDND